MICQHYHSDTDKRCKAQATTEITLWQKSDGMYAQPKQIWHTRTCTAHAQWYVHQEFYKVKQLEER